MSEQVLKLFKDTGVIMEGHFLLTSGLHSPVYWEKFRILQYPKHIEILCRMIADRFKKEKVEWVAGPAMGGIILAYEVAKILGVRGIYAEKEGNDRVFRRGHPIIAGDSVLIVDDIVTTGGSVIEVIKAVQKAGGNAIGAGVLVDRSSVGIDLEIPFFSCLRTTTKTYKPEECPLCKQGIPLVRLGG
ncbi:MAG TPA: orotate phosphoribosyltransferase [Dehalococcoidia bacterium]|nr:orotate phosphoribosyltransferase [Dehalococcoidia bacterium]